MDRSYLALRRRRRRRRQKPSSSSSSPLLFGSSSRGIKIWAKKRVARYFHRVMGRASRVFTHWWAKLRSGFHRGNPGPGSGRGYVHVAQEKDHVRRAPKGHLVVYVGPAVDGGAEAAAERMVVPLIYVNHPLFKRLLEDAEENFGFDYSGCLTIPCPISEFETVKNRIAMGRT